MKPWVRLPLLFIGGGLVLAVCTLCLAWIERGVKVDRVHRISAVSAKTTIDAHKPIRFDSGIVRQERDGLILEHQGSVARLSAKRFQGSTLLAEHDFAPGHKATAAFMNDRVVFADSGGSIHMYDFAGQPLGEVTEADLRQQMPNLEFERRVPIRGSHGGHESFLHGVMDGGDTLLVAVGKTHLVELHPSQDPPQILSSRSIGFSEALLVGGFQEWEPSSLGEPESYSDLAPVRNTPHLSWLLTVFAVPLLAFGAYALVRRRWEGHV